MEGLEEGAIVTSTDYDRDDEDHEFYEQALTEGEVLREGDQLRAHQRRPDGGLPGRGQGKASKAMLPVLFGEDQVPHWGEVLSALNRANAANAANRSDGRTLFPHLAGSGNRPEIGSSSAVARRSLLAPARACLDGMDSRGRRMAGLARARAGWGVSVAHQISGLIDRHLRIPGARRSLAARRLIRLGIKAYTAYNLVYHRGKSWWALSRPPVRFCESRGTARSPGYSTA